MNLNAHMAAEFWDGPGHVTVQLSPQLGVRWAMFQVGDKPLLLAQSREIAAAVIAEVNLLAGYAMGSSGVRRA